MAYKVYAGNLPWSVDAAELQQLFEPFGPVISAEIVSDPRTGRSRGFGFVQMDAEGDAQRAAAALDGVHLQGRPIRVAIAN